MIGVTIVVAISLMVCMTPEAITATAITIGGIASLSVLVGS
jgi:hypothetical protein